jgi:CheY-like chemotaxis protein
MTRSVLIVDDDPFIRRLIATTLEDVAGFDIQEAGDGVEAIAAARAIDPAIVFLDIDMPLMNGIDACRELRAAIT